MRHALILSIALTAVAGAAAAQSRPPANGQAAGLRYLNWAGKPDANPAPSQSDTQPLRPAMGRGAPARVIPHAGGMASAPAPAPAPHGLTPANAWMRPPAAPVEAAPAPNPPPPAAASTPAPAPAADAADPMAPRRDAAIFRMGGEAGSSAPPTPVQTAAASAAPARYYSVHRQYGRQPDAIAMPAPVYLDALPVELERAPQSEDLAEPPAAPTVLRDANGRVRPAPPTATDDIS